MRRCTKPAVRSIAGLCRSEEHTSELQSLRRISYAVFCLKNKKSGHLLLCEHPHVFTLGARGDLDHLVDPDVVDADVVHVDRGGDITYHCSWQLVRYPIFTGTGTLFPYTTLFR